MIMDETSPELKDTIGAGAYFIAAAKALGRTPIDMQISIDDHRPHRRQAMICAIGNVGKLAGNLTLIPGRGLTTADSISTWRRRIASRIGCAHSSG